MAFDPNKDIKPVDMAVIDSIKNDPASIRRCISGLANNTDEYSKGVQGTLSSMLNHITTQNVSSKYTPPLSRTPQKGSGCFITTAVCSTLGKADNCDELVAFRKFRDTFMFETAEMRGEVEEYYEVAPQICEAIDKTGQETALQAYSAIWSSSLKPAFEALSAGENRKAHDIYKQMVLELKESYLLEEE
jgi:hypothetical protein